MEFKTELQKLVTRWEKIDNDLQNAWAIANEQNEEESAQRIICRRRYLCRCIDDVERLLNEKPVTDATCKECGRAFPLHFPYCKSFKNI